MTDIQKELLKLLKEIAAICEKHDIAYYLAGGTLIGAIRHKGFIPWDDDLDIKMTRDNWLKFIEACKTDLPPDRVLDCQELNRNYRNTFGRYIDTSATSIHKGELLGGGSAGFVIDIFPLDPIPDMEAFQRYSEDMLLYSDIINAQGNYSYRYGVNKERYFEAMREIEKNGEEAKDKILTELEERMFTYDEDECDYCVVRWGGLFFLFDKDVFGHSRYAQFEDGQFMVPDKTSDYLVRHFGDEWTTIPPHDEQVEHDAIFSLEIDYKTFQDDYMPLIDPELVRRQWIERKKHIFNIMESRLLMHENRAKAVGILRGMELMKRIEQSEADVDELLKAEQYDVLSELFNDYFTFQCSRELIGREDFGGIQRFVAPVFIDIPDNVFLAAVMTLINTNRLSKADRLLDVREYAKGKCSGGLAEARERVLRFRHIISNYDLGKIDEATAEAEKMYSENPVMMGLEMFLIRVYMETERYSEAKTIIDKCMERYPEEGYFTKYLGDYYLKVNGDCDAAMDCYKKAEESTDNGMVLLEISEIMERFNENGNHEA